MILEYTDDYDQNMKCFICVIILNFIVIIMLLMVFINEFAYERELGEMIRVFLILISHYLEYKTVLKLVANIFPLNGSIECEKLIIRFALINRLKN